mmetsp:Transcript_11146/g.25799  ORF Transcript_11146/g.25799 Transcript_11146/m.25799 type:complete len:208 (-) Transcript_11146:236-859(-)
MFAATPPPASAAAVPGGAGDARRIRSRGHVMARGWGGRGRARASLASLMSESVTRKCCDRASASMRCSPSIIPSTKPGPLAPSCKVAKVARGMQTTAAKASQCTRFAPGDGTDPPTARSAAAISTNPFSSSGASHTKYSSTISWGIGVPRSSEIPDERPGAGGGAAVTFAWGVARRLISSERRVSAGRVRDVNMRGPGGGAGAARRE